MNSRQKDKVWGKFGIKYVSFRPLGGGRLRHNQTGEIIGPGQSKRFRASIERADHRKPKKEKKKSPIFGYRNSVMCPNERCGRVHDWQEPGVVQCRCGTSFIAVREEGSKIGALRARISIFNEVVCPHRGCGHRFWVADRGVKPCPNCHELIEVHH